MLIRLEPLGLLPSAPWLRCMGLDEYLVVHGRARITASMHERDHDDHEYDQHDPGRGDAHRALAPPELGVRAIARVPALRRSADPVVLVVERAHKPQLRARGPLGSPARKCDQHCARGGQAHRVRASGWRQSAHAGGALKPAALGFGPEALAPERDSAG